MVVIFQSFVLMEQLPITVNNVTSGIITATTFIMEILLVIHGSGSKLNIYGNLSSGVTSGKLTQEDVTKYKDKFKLVVN